MCCCATGGMHSWLTLSLFPPSGDSRSVALLEGQLTWLVHIVGAIIRGRLSSSSAETQVRAPAPCLPLMSCLPYCLPAMPPVPLNLLLSTFS